jgi:hypothetical protein
VWTWRRFVTWFAAVFGGGIAALYLFVLLVDPYDVIPFSLPIERRIVSISQRHMYPQMIRSRRFDSVIIGTSTARLLDPAILGSLFDARFVNLAMDAMTAWEQQRIVDYFLRQAGEPRVLVVGLDAVWCDEAADRNRITFRGFPEWLYDDNRWNDALYLLNRETIEIAGRLVGYHLGLYPERVRYDGFEVFVPDEGKYDLVRARQHIWRNRPHGVVAVVPPIELNAAEKQSLAFPALAWLDAMLATLPAGTLKVLAYMPVHVAAQPTPGSRGAARERECKDRIAGIARKRGASIVDWRFASTITREDTNYWDPLHYRLPIAERIALELAAAVLEGRTSPDGSYRIIVR